MPKSARGTGARIPRASRNDNPGKGPGSGGGRPGRPGQGGHGGGGGNPHLTYDQVVLQDSPSIYWTLANQSVVNIGSLGTGLNLTKTGSLANGVVLPNGDASTDFNTGALNTYMSAPDNDIFSWSWLGGTRTIEYWLYETARTNRYRFYFRKGNASPDFEYACYQDTNISAANFEMDRYNSTGSSTLTIQVTCASLNNWHHIVWKWTGSTYAYYVDNAITNSGNTLVAPNPTNQAGLFYIGGGPNALSVYVAGSIGKFAVYSDAISDARIAAHYAKMTS